MENDLPTTLIAYLCFAGMGKRDYSSDSEGSVYDEEEDNDSTFKSYQACDAGARTAEGTNCFYPVFPLHTEQHRQSDEYFSFLPDKFYERDPYFGEGTPHEGTTLDGMCMDQLEFNLCRAVECGDVDYTSRCLMALFRWFVTLNRPMRIVLPPRCPLAVQRCFSINIGPFTSLNALAMHQKIWNVICTLYLEHVGVGTPTALLGISEMWKKYEEHLFCDPYTSIAALLGIAQILCMSYKDGSVAYAMHVWADTAEMRKWRSDAVAEDSTLYRVMDREMLDLAYEQLTATPQYYTDRSRQLKYQEDAVRDLHIMYVLQGKKMRTINVRQFVAKIQEKLDVYIRNNPGDRFAKDLGGRLLQRTFELCWIEGSDVNNLLSPKDTQILQNKFLTFLQLIGQCLDSKLMQGYGEMGWFTTACYRLDSLQHQVVTPEYAGKLYATRLDRVRPVYGLLSSDVRVSKPDTTKKRKTGTAAAFEQDITPRYARKYRYLHPSLEMTESGVINWIAGRHVHMHPVVRRALAYLGELYKAQWNWKKMAVLTADRHSVQLDTGLFEFDRDSKVLYQAEDKNYHMVSVLLKNSGHLDWHPAEVANPKTSSSTVTKKKTGVTTTPEKQTNLSGTKSESSDANNRRMRFGISRDVGALLIEALSPTSFTKTERKPRAFVLGPFPTSMYSDLQAVVESRIEAQRESGIECYKSFVVEALLVGFPVRGLVLGSSIRYDKPVCYVVHVPYQHRYDCLKTYNQSMEFFLQAKLYDEVAVKIQKALPLQNMLSYIRQHGRCPIDDLSDQVFLYVNLCMPPGKKEMELRSARLCVVMDDLFPAKADRRKMDSWYQNKIKELGEVL